MAKQIITKNVKEALQAFASDTLTPLRSCDFTLHGVATYIKTCNIDTFAKFDEIYKARYSSEDALINDRVLLKQLYKITPKKLQKGAIDLRYGLDKGAFNTHPVLHIHPDSQIKTGKLSPQQFLVLLVQECNKIKAKEGMLIGLFSQCMIEDLKLLVKKIYTKQFDAPVQVLLFDGIEPELSEPEKLTLFFKKKQAANKIAEVEPGELIVEYIRPVYGRNGFSATGSRVLSKDSTRKLGFEAEIDEESIRVEEDEEKILLYSKRRGYVQYTGKTISISNTISLEKVRRVESKVAQEEQNEVEVRIAQDDITQDSVGEGVQLTSEILHITGHVGDKAKLEAKALTVEGATHSGAELYAKEAIVNRHKGLLRCHKAHIKLLEGGEVHATHVHIDAALGGTVYAEFVTIGQVKHNLKAYATGAIEIDRLSGEDNLFAIDYRAIPIMTSRIQYINEDIAELNYHLEEAYKNAPDTIASIQEKIRTFKEEIRIIEQSSFDASITIKERVMGLNTIRFALPKNSQVTFKTQANEKYETFYLEHAEESDEATLLPVGLTQSW